MLKIVKKTRKRRSDRNHVIYLIENEVTGEQYIGVTVLSFKGNADLTARRRALKHFQRAKTENKDWPLSKSIRKHGTDSFVYAVLEVVRGKSAAHARELEYIKTEQPKLNSVGT